MKAAERVVDVRLLPMKERLGKIQTSLLKKLPRRVLIDDFDS